MTRMLRISLHVFCSSSFVVSFLFIYFFNSVHTLFRHIFNHYVITKNITLKVTDWNFYSDLIPNEKLYK